MRWRAERSRATGRGRATVGQHCGQREQRAAAASTAAVGGAAAGAACWLHVRVHPRDNDAWVHPRDNGLCEEAKRDSLAHWTFPLSDNFALRTCRTTYTQNSIAIYMILKHRDQELSGAVVSVPGP